MITKISFVGILVKDIEEAQAHFIKVFGLKPWDMGIVEMPGVKAVMFPLGDCSIELLQPTVGSDAPVGGDLARRLEKYGEGVCRLGHYVRCRVPHVLQSFQFLGILSFFLSQF